MAAHITIHYRLTSDYSQLLNTSPVSFRFVQEKKKISSSFFFGMGEGKAVPFRILFPCNC